MELNTYNVKLQRGICVLARTAQMDPRFAMSVALLCMHDDEGSFGLVLNQATNLFFDIERQELLAEQTGDSCFPVSTGGPVQQEALFFLYSSEESHEEGIEVLPGVQMASSKKVLDDLQQKGQLTADSVRFFLGYSGWSYFQLDCEVSNGSWFACAGEHGDVFHDHSSNLWLTILKRMGPDFYSRGKLILESYQ